MGRKSVIILLSAVAAGLLLLSLKLPIWKMRMEAPQYQDEEALDVMVYPNALRGDMDELKVLNSYIGVHVPDTLPQTRWLPGVLVAAGIGGILAAFLPRRFRKPALIIVPSVLAVALMAAAIQAQWQMHEIGTNRDEKTTLIGVKDFTTPLIGRTRIAQFTITSYLSWGSLAIAASIGLLWAGAWLSRTPKREPSNGENPPSHMVGGLATDSSA